jgi:hypothetical protein
MDPKKIFKKICNANKAMTACYQQKNSSHIDLSTVLELGAKIFSVKRKDF